MKKWLAIVALVGVALGLLLWQRKAEAPRAVVIGGGTAVVGGGSISATSGGVVAGGKLIASTDSSTPSGPPADPEFQKWLEHESLNVDSPQGGGSAKGEELARVAGTLTPAQANQLLHTALSDHSPASEKILSVYLLGEGGVRSRAQLIELIQTPLPDRGPPTAHSPAETLSASDRARVLMAIEALAAQAKKDNALIPALAQAIAGIQDPNVKRLAQKYLDELRGH